MSEISPFACGWPRPLVCVRFIPLTTTCTHWWKPKLLEQVPTPCSRSPAYRMPRGHDSTGSHVLAHRAGFILGEPQKMDLFRFFWPELTVVDPCL